jgi:dihydroorotate dehydrogenase (NAD+) catalytic subunit
VSSDEGWNVPPATLSKLGAFVTKTITALPRGGHPQPWAESLAPGTLVNAAGLPNPGIQAALVEWAHLPELLQVPIVVSIGGDAQSMPLLAERVQQSGWASAIELNLSCPNVDGGLVAGDPAATADIVSRVRARTSLPLLAKLTPACGAPGRVARAAEEAGADGVTCGNTMPVRAARADGEPLLGAGMNGGMSGAHLHPIALRLVDEVARCVRVPIIGLGGIDGVAAADAMFAAGASAIAVGTGQVHDPHLIDALVDHIAARPHASR